MPLASPIHSGSGEWSYSETTDGTSYFISTRPGGMGGMGGMDLYRTRRETGQALSVVNLGSLLNSPYHDRATCIAPDGAYLIFSSARSGDFADRCPHQSFRE